MIAKNPINLNNIFVSKKNISINNLNSPLYTFLIKYPAITWYLNNLRKLDHVKYFFSLAISLRLGSFHLDLDTLYSTTPTHKQIKPTRSVLKTIYHIPNEESKNIISSVLGKSLKIIIIIFK